ncbi:MAG: class I SAM-dependent methyltransferase [Solirubrobacterales bacterium]
MDHSATLAARVAERSWYHTIELAPGIVTPGYFDTREAAAKVPMPESLQGLRCLDVGTFDGFWAFEMERRGADAVLAVDITQPDRWDWPAGSETAVRQQIAERKGDGSGFEVAHDALGSSVQRRELSIYDLDSAELGSFDFVYVGSLLLHLRDPVGGLMRIRDVCRGQVLVVDAIDPVLSVLQPRRPTASLDGQGRPWWWRPNLAGLRRMVEAAGFDLVVAPSKLALRSGAGDPARLTPRGLLSTGGRDMLRRRVAGDPHAALLARPRT